MVSRAAPTHATLRQVQPVVCINYSDTPAGLLQPLRNLFSNKAFAAGIDTADADNNGTLRRRHSALRNDSRNERLESFQTCAGITRARLLCIVDAAVTWSCFRRR